MKLGDLDFPVDDYSQLPYRDLVDLRDFLKKGLASSFWLAYREIVDGNAVGFRTQLTRPSELPSLDGSFRTAYVQGQLNAAEMLGNWMDQFLEDVDQLIQAKQANGETDDDTDRQPRPDTSSVDPSSSP